MRITFKVTWPSGDVRYFRKLKDAREAFKNWDENPETGALGKASQLSKVWLAEDAFERAVNGGGGYEESETILKERP